MEDPMSYHIYDSIGQVWLGVDETSWVSDYMDAASFMNFRTAQDIGEREGENRIIYIFACMPS